MLTSNLKPRSHSNFFYMCFRLNVFGCSFPCLVIPGGILTLLPHSICSHVHAFVKWCGLKIITWEGGGGEGSIRHGSVNPVHCVAVKRAVALVQQMRTMGAEMPERNMKITALVLCATLISLYK